MTTSISSVRYVKKDYPLHNLRFWVIVQVLFSGVVLRHPNNNSKRLVEDTNYSLYIHLNFAKCVYIYIYIHLYIINITYIYIYMIYKDNIYLCCIYIYIERERETERDRERESVSYLCTHLTSLFNYFRFLLIQTDNWHVLFMLVHLVYR